MRLSSVYARIIAMKIRTFLTLSTTLAAALAGRPAVADVYPAALFSDHVVLQQGMRVPVWGTAQSGERVARPV